MTQEKSKRLMRQLLSHIIDKAFEAKELLDTKQRTISKDVAKAVNEIRSMAEALEDLESLSRNGKK